MSGAFATVIRRSIRGSLGRFLAIIGIVAGAVAVVAVVTVIIVKKKRARRERELEA